MDIKESAALYQPEKGKNNHMIHSAVRDGDLCPVCADRGERGKCSAKRIAGVLGRELFG